MCAAVTLHACGDGTKDVMTSTNGNYHLVFMVLAVTLVLAALLTLRLPAPAR